MNLPFTQPRIDHDQIVAAIGRAEEKTSGEIRVLISRGAAADPVAEARRHFERLGMTRTAARNGVLIYVAPASRTFAVIGDTGIHERCGETFWRDLADAMTERFRAGEFEAGIVLGVERAGTLLAQHFPRQPDDRNELPNTVEHD